MNSFRNDFLNDIMKFTFIPLTTIHLLSILFTTLLLVTSCEDKKDVKPLASTTDANKKEKLFRMVPSAESNLTFSNMLTETDEMNIMTYPYFYSGGGVACGDINNDGLVDVYLTANQEQDRLYHNKGALKFEDVSETHLPKFEDSIWTTGVTMADVNADGWLDIYVCRSGKAEPNKRRNSLLINQQDGSFRDEAVAYGLDDPGYSTQAAFFDYDKDGDLDMYLLNHHIIGFNKFNKQERESRHPYVGDKLYRNDGSKFTEVGKQAGIIANPYGYGLGVAISDLNDDGWPDIYVSNDFQENDFMYVNNQNGTFTETIQSATKHISNFGMGVDVADINDDGLQDIFVVDMVAEDNFRLKTNMSGMNPERFWKSIAFGFHYQYMYNTFQLNQGNMKFSEIGQLLGVSSTDWSWTCLMVDLDLDGNKDILVTNGLKKEVRNNDYAREHLMYAEKMPKNQGLDSLTIMWNQLKDAPSNKIANYAFKNNGKLSFSDKSDEWGLAAKGFTTGAAYADLDNDGDLDLIMNNVDEEAFLYENLSMNNTPRNYIKVDLKGPKNNPFGIGSVVQLTTKNQKQEIEIYQTRGFQSCIPPVAHFGLEENPGIASLKVIWPNGNTETVSIAEPSKTLTVDHANSLSDALIITKEPVLFADITKALGVEYEHKENYYDDFEDQVLLPHKLSQLGPAVADGDVNGDGLEDFLVGGAHGYSPVLFKQTKNGAFKKIENPLKEHDKNFEDVEALFFDVDNDNDLDLYMGSSGYEFTLSTGHLADRIYLNDGNGNFTWSVNALPDVKVSTGCVKPFDYDNDGDLDLFVGGRLLPKMYPLSPRSYLLKNEQGIYSDVTETVAPEVANIGMVTDAEWVNIDDSKSAELVVVGEWMPITVFTYQNDTFAKMDNQKLGLDKSNGWWFSLETVDIDNDGDQDLVAGNLGLNYKYKASESSPFKVYTEDFDNNETVDIVLSYAQNGIYYPVRGRECSSQQLPFIKKKFPDYKSFASASVEEVLGLDNVGKSSIYNVYTFASSLLINNDGKFATTPLNYNLQLSSINDILATDLNNDGFKDLITAGNLYTSEVETPRADASYGNILLGNGSGSFRVLPPAQCNYFGEDDVKKIKAIQLSNGKTAFIVGRNSGVLKIYQYD